MENIEVELKFPLLNPEAAVKHLDKVAKREGEWRQVDTYFNHPQRDFLAAQPIVEWLRIRDTEKGASFNYKRWHHTKERRTVSCDENETKVSDVAQLRSIVTALGFTEICTLHKHRRTWRYKDVEVAVDDCAELGVFVELEAKGDFKDIETAKAHLYKITEELALELGEQDLRGYPFLLLEKQGRKLL